MPAIEGGPVAVDHGEPLARELEDFLAAIREGRPATVTGAAGRQALELAQRITEQMTSVR
jgi:predicted dehydrogenase